MKVKTKTQAPADIAVSDADNISLTINIGDAQIGGSVVQFSGSPNPIGKGEIAALALGTGAALKGKTLNVTTNILDVNKASMLVSAAHQFQNGNPPAFNLADSVDNVGDIFSWATTYNFK